jgi:hypothetical protein
MKTNLNTGLRTGVAVAVLAVLSPSPVHGQVTGPNLRSAQALLSSSNPAQAGQPAAGEVIREIDDPHNGDHWLLMRDLVHPAGPGRLVRISGIGLQTRNSGPGGVQPKTALAVEQTKFLPVIHTGDVLIVEENTALVEARLEAVALSPAVSGLAFNVRLKIGGNVVRAVALGPGRAAFAPESEARP